jgi:hypothetical protein
MPIDPHRTNIYHITDVSNLPSIIASTGIHSDANMILAGAQPTVIGYTHIKERRMSEYTVPCCGNRFVGEFVPFYYCPRSPMLYTINKGNAGRAAGCQTSVIHLVSTVGQGMALGRDWAISDGNAGAAYTEFSNSLAFLDSLDWSVIRSDNWAKLAHKKQSEFLVADFFPWQAVSHIVCHNEETASQVRLMTVRQAHIPLIQANRSWYYP